MKSALSLTLIVCLVGSALPAAAQNRISGSSGPIERAIEREAIRFSTAGEPAISDVGTAQQSGSIQTPNGGWRVAKDALIGAGIGAGAGYLIHKAGCPDDCHSIGLGAAIGASVGAATGALSQSKLSRGAKIGIGVAIGVAGFFLAVAAVCGSSGCSG